MYEYKGVVTRVVDGDTIDVEIDQGFGDTTKRRLRLFGIDAPETYGVKKDSTEYALGKAATEWMEEKIGGRTVIIQTHKDRQGKFGRYLAKVFLPSNGSDIGQDVLAEMVEAGHAEAKDY